MNKDMPQFVKEIDDLVDNFVRQAQTIPLMDTEYGQSVKEVLLEKFKPGISQDAMNLLQKISDDMWDKSGKSFGYFEVDSKVAIKNGNVVLGFVVSPDLRVNRDNNQLFVKQLNSSLPTKYNGLMSRIVKSIKGMPPELVFDFFQINGSV